MTIHYKSTPEDMIAFYNWYVAFSPEGKKQMRAVLTTIYLLPLILNMLFCLTHPGRIPVFLVVTAIETAVLALFLPKILATSRRKQLLKMYDKKEYAHFFGGTSVEAQQEGILYITDQSTSLIKWTAFQEIASTNTHAFLRMGPASAIVIPRDKVGEGNFDMFVVEAKRLHQQAKGGDNPIPIPAR